ncbi:putative cytoplasmic protein USSDB7A [Candidatus Burkholderia pumila]|uniref:Cytoplasmic protein USSDB7A n=1 Tax=Candidatus Burkholderia pumila TaxID=1090375 RepID=A0ABR5HKZ0_9BURK|nr:putative cytoplasmic protein USSDB7A [Candidatus Burkholderia pumila]
MTQDIFVIVDGIDGESQNATYPRSIEAWSWHFEINQPSSMHAGSDGGLGRASVSGMHFVHCVDRASPNILRHSLIGRHIAQVRLVQRKAGGLPFDFLKLILNDVIVSRVEQACAGGLMIKHVALSFAQLRCECAVQGAKGGNLGRLKFWSM